MHIADKLLRRHQALSAKDRIRLQALAGLGPAAALTPILIVVGEKYGLLSAILIGVLAMIISSYGLIYLRSRMQGAWFLLLGLCSLLVCWAISVVLFAYLLINL